MTWLDIASDAVKIGLGALIAGLFALVGSIVSHRHRLTEEYSRRRRDALEKLAVEFDEITMIGMDRICSWLALTAPEKTKAGKRFQKLMTRQMLDETSLLSSLYSLHGIEAKLALLLLPHIAEAVESYREVFCQVDSQDEGPEGLQAQRVKLEEALRKQRTYVMTLMAEAYRRA